MMKIYCCDAIYFLASLKEAGEQVDMILTDPENTWAPGFNLQWLQLSYGILKDGGVICSFCSPPTLDDYKKQVEEAGFACLQTFNHFNRRTEQMEPLIIASKGKIETKAFTCMPYELETAVEGFPGNAQKPVKLLKALIEHFTKEGELVVDFFMGSGTTALACRETNRNFKGCEKNPDFCGVAKKRLGFTDLCQTGI